MSSHTQSGGPGSQPAPSWASVCREIHVDEEVELALSLALERFGCSEETEMDFPSCFSGTERAFIHQMARTLGYISKSRGRGSERSLTVRKRDGSEKWKLVVPLFVSYSSLDGVRMLLQSLPASKPACASTQSSSRTGACVSAEGERSSDRIKAGGCGNNHFPKVPPMRAASELDQFRRSLPVMEHQAEIVQTVRDHQVVLVVGEAGSGKTTQIPQFLLDDCSRRGEACRIFCTQPRDLSAVTVAERVAAERRESLGHTVGYHIRRESRVSLTTLLTFCTTGMFLKTLTTGETTLSTVTHVIMDEVHERDGLSDLLLTKMRDMLLKLPSVKLVVTSAALDTELFIRFFGSCPLVHVKGRLFEVKEFFLEDVLKMTEPTNISKHKEELRAQKRKQKCLSDLLEAVDGKPATDERKPVTAAAVCSVWDKEQTPFNQLGGSEELLLAFIDSCIYKVFLDQDQESFQQLFELILSGSVDVDFLHSDTGVTPLMAAASRGLLPPMEQLLSKGADMNIRASNGWTALDFAKRFEQNEAVDLLEASIPLQPQSRLEESCLPQDEGPELGPDHQDPHGVHLHLITNLLHSICSTSTQGAVLIFLPGYDEMVALRDLLLFDDERFTSHSERYTVFTLHSDMQTINQEALEAPPAGVRKIILSTHIAETSITINDVVFVIDSGKVKQKFFDPLSRASGSETVWISKASALQRKGRAGRCRPGICFRLFSRLRFNKLVDLQVAQLLQIPLQELCLQTKLLAPSSCSVEEFLSRAPQPPPQQAVRRALHALKSVGAMDLNEDLSDLGLRLVDLPLAPQLGKMVLSAAVLKCLDPVLTIACTLAHRDPFLVPPQSSQRRAALLSRQSFSCRTLSDHMALLRAFQAWQKACSEGWERSFCEKNFLCQATLEMILNMRTQLLGQLRAIGFVRANGGSDIRDVNVNSHNWAVVKAALVAGMYPNLITVEAQASGKKVHFHPTSVLNVFRENQQAPPTPTVPTDWFVYDEMRRRHDTVSVRCVSVVTAVSVALFAGGDQQHAANESQTTADEAAADGSDSEAEDLAELGIDHQVAFQLERESGRLVLDLRHKWQELFIRRIRCPSKAWSQQDEAIVHTLVSVLEGEEQRAGLPQPAGIGRRPVLMPSEGLQPPSRSSKSSSDRSSEILQINEFQPEEASPDAHSSATSSCRPPPPPAFSPAKVQQLLQILSPGLGFPSTRYFIMKSNNFRNIDISQRKGIWSTTAANESKLSAAFLENSAVVLIFSVQGSGHFQGYARMTSAVREESCPDWDVLGLGGPFGVDWIRTDKLSFQRTQHIFNPWNNNNMVQISRDGQELEPQVANQLLSLWEHPMESQ